MNDIIDFLMDPLRLTLIIAGVVVLFAIIIFGRKSNRRHDFTYVTPSSKEFTFGTQKREGMPTEMLSDEEVVVLPRKQSVVTPHETEYESIPNAYNVKTEPRKPQFSEFRAFQGSVEGEQMDCEVFEDESITSSPFIRKKKATPAVAEEKVPKRMFEPEAEIIPTPPIAKRKKEEETPEIEKTETKREIKTKVETESATAVEVVEPSSKPETNVNSETKTEKTPAKPTRERFIVLHVIAAEGKPFNGLDILDATKTQGLAFGKHAIFHYPMSAAPAGDSKFCLVNMSPEGNFETNKISSLETNGISLIMRLPIRGADSLTVFSNMLGVSQALARKLGGEILDQARIPLTAEIVSTIRSDIAHFNEAYKLSEQTKEAIPEV